MTTPLPPPQAVTPHHTSYKSHRVTSPHFTSKLAAMTLFFFASLTIFLTAIAVALDRDIFRLAGDVVAISPALVRKTVGALARSGPARAAADALIYLFLGMVCVMFTATFFNEVTVRACGESCTMAVVLTEILDYSATISLLLLAPAFALFFLRAAGCSSEFAETLVVKDFDDPSSSPSESLRSPLRLAVAGFFLGIVSVILEMCGFPRISGLLDVVPLLCDHLFAVLVYIRTAGALWQMNYMPSNMVAE